MTRPPPPPRPPPLTRVQVWKREWDLFRVQRRVARLAQRLKKPLPRVYDRGQL